MIYNTIVNGSSQKKPIPFNQRTNLSNNEKFNHERRVTFVDSHRHKQQVIHPTNQPKYNFTYGQPRNPSVQKKIIQQSIYRNYSPNFETFQIEPRQSLLTENSLVKNEKTSSPSKGKRRLKIFPEKFEQNKNKTQNIVQQKKEEPKDYVKDQVKELKKQIEKLKSQIKNLSLNMSKNISKDFTETQINKNQAERTRRLSQLNQFNEKLYNELALKLKEISISEYQSYLDQKNSNKKILDQIFQSSNKSRAQLNSGQKKQSVNQNFMDIKEFQQEYQQKYVSTGGTQNPVQILDFVPQQNVSSSYEIGSPFMIFDNKFQRTDTKQELSRTNSNSKNYQKEQAFTFHKQRMGNQKHFKKPIYQDNKLFTLEGQSKTYKRENFTQKQRKQPNTRPQVFQTTRVKTTENFNKNQKRIQDFNRQLQNKIFKKRVKSQYTPINKQKKY